LHASLQGLEIVGKACLGGDDVSLGHGVNTVAAASGRDEIDEYINEIMSHATAVGL